MKAVKLTKITWNLDEVGDENKAKVLNTLPSVKGFTARDDFNVPENAPRILKKKYGYEIKDLSFSEFHIIEELDELLDFCKHPKDKEKKLYKAGGKLSAVGEAALENLKSLIRERLRLEFNGVSDENMPKKMDIIMLGVENVSGLEWKGHTVEELTNPIVKKIWDKRATNLKDAYDMVMEKKAEAAEGDVESEDEDED